MHLALERKTGREKARRVESRVESTLVRFGFNMTRRRSFANVPPIIPAQNNENLIAQALVLVLGQLSMEGFDPPFMAKKSRLARPSLDWGFGISSLW